MNFNTEVDRGFVDSILESSLWHKAKIEVVAREVVNESSEEGEFEIAPDMENHGNQYQEPQEIAYEGEPEVIEEDENISFSLDDLQVVLDNLAEEDLMEHALSMLDVFDVAYENIAESEEEYDEEEYEEDEEELEEAKYKQKDDTRDLPLSKMTKAQRAQLKTHTGARGLKTTKGGKGGHSRLSQQALGMTQASIGGEEGSARHSR